MAKGIPALDRIRKDLQALHGAKIVVGVQREDGINFGGETVSSSNDMQKIAYVHEYGWDIEVTPKMRAWLHYNGIHLKADTTHIHIPERSFLRQAQANGKAKFLNVYSEQGKRMIQGDISAVDLLHTLGRTALEETTAALGSNAKPVTQYTLDHRKENKNPTPLTDTGNLHRHITYRVEKSGGGGKSTASWGGG